MIPTIIEYVVILLIVIALLPFILVGLAKFPFLHMEVGGYLPSAFYMIISMVVGVLFTLLLYPLMHKRISPMVLLMIGYLFSFFTYYLADLLIEGVTIPLYMEMFFALFSNNLATINTSN